MKIQVTMAHIRGGTPGDCDSCPVALAMFEAGLLHPSVYNNFINWVENGVQKTVPTPAIVQAFLNRFDDPAEEVPQIKEWSLSLFQPFEFELPVEMDQKEAKPHAV